MDSYDEILKRHDLEKLVGNCKPANIISMPKTNGRDDEHTNLVKYHMQRILYDIKGENADFFSIPDMYDGDLTDDENYDTVCLKTAGISYKEYIHQKDIAKHPVQAQKDFKVIERDTQVEMRGEEAVKRDEIENKLNDKISEWGKETMLCSNIWNFNKNMELHDEFKKSKPSYLRAYLNSITMQAIAKSVPWIKEEI